MPSLCVVASILQFRWNSIQQRKNTMNPHSPSSGRETNLVAGWDEYLCRDRLSWPGLFVNSPGRKITEKPLPVSGGDGHESDLICPPRSSGEPERCIDRGSTRSTVKWRKSFQSLANLQCCRTLTVIAWNNHWTDCWPIGNDSRWGRRQRITVAIIGRTNIFHFDWTRIALHITRFV